MINVFNQKDYGDSRDGSVVTAFLALSKDSNLVPSTHMVASQPSPVPGDPILFIDLHWHQECMW